MFMIVQQLLEDVSGEPFPIIVHETVLASWEMDSSTFESPLPEHLVGIAASGHRQDGSPIPGGWYTYPEMRAGTSMWSTPSDLARFAINVMRSYIGESKGVLSREMALELLTSQPDGRGMDFELRDDGGDLFYFIHHPTCNP